MMADRSKIEWCDSTFNPWIGCTKVSPACDNCYAEADFDKRRGMVKWGAGQERHRTTAANWRKPLRWNATPFYECTDCGWRGDKPSTQGGSFTDGLPSCPHCDSMGLIDARRRVFCASLADVFDNEVPPAWRVDLLRLIADTPNLDWLLLTKRIGNVQKMMVEAFSMGWPNHASTWERWPELFRTIWLGASICTQAEADRDIPKLLAVPAAVRFVSMEPLLGPVTLRSFCACGCMLPIGQAISEIMRGPSALNEDQANAAIEKTLGLDWVIVGGESGPNARPMHPDWARSLRNQCAAFGVPFLFKQWGEFLPGSANDADPSVVDVPESRLYWSDGSKWDCYDGQRAGVDLVARVGKKAAGRLLDGRTHDEWPA